MHVIRLAARLLPCVVATSVAAQSNARDNGTVTIVIGAEPTLPVPTLSLFQADVDVASLMFLRLARLGRKVATADESQFEPELARRWSRPDPLTLVFELDPKARWHDGTPVTSRDVVWSLNRARDSTIVPAYAVLLRRIAAVTAQGPSRVVVKFKEAYGEQLYDAAWQVPPLPAHLLDTIPPNRLATSPFASHPIGNGPFRWGRLDPGQKVELTVNPDFFLGRPKFDRVVFLLIRSAEAQLNAVLGGTADVFEGVLLQRDIGPIVARPDLRIVTIPSFTVSYLLMNRRVAGDRSQPHPILSDREVRRAIGLAIDRGSLLKATFGPYAMEVPGPMGQASWIRRITPKQPAFDPQAAAAILRDRGWSDSDRDGVLDRQGVPLTLKLIYPGTSAPRVALAEPIQQMLRRVGINVELIRLDGPIWRERRTKGEFDIDFSQVTLDPTPSGLVQSWSCAGVGGSNVAGWCLPAFDQALAQAITATGDANARWTTALRTLTDDVPAVFLYSPVRTAVVNARLRNVSFRPEAILTDVWRWSVDPARRTDRDR